MRPRPVMGCLLSRSRFWVQETQAELPCPAVSLLSWNTVGFMPDFTCRWGSPPSVLMSLFPFGEKVKHELGSKFHNKRKLREMLPNFGVSPSSSFRSQRGEHLHVPSRGPWCTDSPPGPSRTRCQPSLLLLPAHPHPRLSGRVRLHPSPRGPCEVPSPALLPAQHTPHRPSLHRRCPPNPRSPPAWVTWGARPCPSATSPTACR